jgi:hypothetical protein
MAGATDIAAGPPVNAPLRRLSRRILHATMRRLTGTATGGARETCHP